MAEVSLHEACYQGQTDIVAELLDGGADPNEPADSKEREWISCAGNRPKPLNCVAIAWQMSDQHVELALLLLDHGAVVDDSVLRDHAVETTGGPADQKLSEILNAAFDKG